MTTPWSDTPPSDAGWYWVLGNHSGEEWPMELCPDGVWAGRVGMIQFGPRVLSAEETVKLTAEVERLRAENRILNERYDLLEQENDSLRRNGAVIYVGSEELQQLRAENAELRENLTVDDLDELERYRSPLGAAPMRPEPNDDDFPTIPFEVVQKLKCVPAEELDQLRAAAAELAEIKRAWGTPKSEI